MSEEELRALNYVHGMASKLWKEAIPPPSPSTLSKSDSSNLFKNQFNSPSLRQNSGKRRIVPVQLSAPTPQVQFTKNGQNEINLTKEIFNSPPYSKAPFKNSNHPNKKRATFKTCPLRPPDIQNIDMFPPISKDSKFTPSPMEVNNSKSNSSNSKFELSKTHGNLEPKENIKSAHVKNEENFRGSENFNAKQIGTQEKCFARVGMGASSEEGPNCLNREELSKNVKKVQMELANNSASVSKCSTQPLVANAFKNDATLPVASKINITSKTSKLRLNDEMPYKGRSSELFSKMSPSDIEGVSGMSCQFSKSLDSNLCRSPLSEFTFLTQLLVANNELPDNKSLITSLPSRVFFVTKVIESQLRKLVPSISSDVLQILVDFYPHRLPKTLRIQIENIIEERGRVFSNLATLRNNVFGSNSSVIFQQEVDGKSNYMSQKDCSDFSKQRDLFYSIREKWGGQIEKRYDPGLGRIRQLFLINSSSTNICRLAKLTISQLVLEERNRVAQLSASSFLEKGSGQENFLRILESNPSKYEKLRMRISNTEEEISKKRNIGDPLDFLIYFVSGAACPAFNQHLIDAALSELIKIENEEVSSWDELFDEIIKSHLIASILGFLYYSPYRDEETKKSMSPINVEIWLNSQIRFRSHQAFPLNLYAMLKKSLKDQKLLLSLTWMSQLFTFADPVTFHLENYRPFFKLLCKIYREVLVVKDNALDKNSYCSMHNLNYLRFLCGRVINLHSFPDSFLMSKNEGSGEVLDYNFMRMEKVRSEGNEEESFVIDQFSSAGIFFTQIYFTREMSEMVSILSANATVRGSIPKESPGLVRHVRPIPQNTVHKNDNKIKNRTNEEMSRIQDELESQFFQIHPPSLRKTVEFISERVASNFVKQLRSKMLVELRKSLAESGKFLEEGMREAKNSIFSQSETYCQERVGVAVKTLISENVIAEVGKICEEICTRGANEKIYTWVHQHVTPELFPEVVNNPESLSQPQNISQNKNVEMIKKEVSISSTHFKTLSLLKQNMVKLHRGLPIDPNSLQIILLDERMHEQKHWIVGQIAELAVSLATFSPSTLSNEAVELFMEFWRRSWRSEFNIFLSSRSLLLYFYESRDLKFTFSAVAQIIGSLLKCGLVSGKDFEIECLGLLRQNWGDELNRHLAQLLHSLCPNLENGDEREVIDWIAWYCSGREEEEF